MELYQWTDDLNLGIEVIDAQHRQIVHYINELTSAISSEDQAQVFAVLDQLRDYTMDHFVFEEQLMAQAQYVLHTAHQAVHRRFEEKILGMQDELRNGRDPFGVARRLRTWLMTWLIQHIRHEDVDYVPAVKKVLKREEGWINSALKRIFGSSTTNA